MQMHVIINHHPQVANSQMNKISDQEINEVINMVFNEGRTFKDACAYVGRSQSVMSKIIRGMGHTIPKESGKGNKKNIPETEVIEMYTSGVSEQAIAKHFNVSRCVIRQRLVSANVKIRTASEACRLSAQQFTLEQRKLRTQKANEASKGSKAKIESKIKRSKFIEKNPMENIIGYGEREFRDKLISQQIPHTWQKSFYQYSLDFLIDGVAVELKSGTFNRGNHDVKSGRIKFLKSHGIPTLYVSFENPNTLLLAFEYIIGVVKKMNENKIPEGEYWAICCRMEKFKKERDSLGRFISKPCEPRLVTYTRVKKY